MRRIAQGKLSLRDMRFPRQSEQVPLERVGNCETYMKL